jgi:hypothetical protein
MDMGVKPANRFLTPSEPKKMSPGESLRLESESRQIYHPTMKETRAIHTVFFAFRLDLPSGVHL